MRDLNLGVTIELKQLEEVPLANLTDESFLHRQESTTSYLKKIEDINVEILDLYVVYDVPENDEKKLDEIKSNSKYAIGIGDRIAVIAKRLHDRDNPPPTGSGVSVKNPRLSYRVSNVANLMGSLKIKWLLRIFFSNFIIVLISLVNCPILVNLFV